MLADERREKFLAELPPRLASEVEVEGADGVAGLAPEPLPEKLKAVHELSALLARPFGAGLCTSAYTTGHRSTSLPAVRAGDDSGRTGRLGRAFHVEGKFAEKPRERDPRVTFDLDLGPGPRLSVAVDEHRPVLRERLAGLSRPIESLASEDE
jgi:hypothetical protein